MPATLARARHHALGIAALATAIVACPDRLQAQASTRLAVLQAEDRRAPTPQDLSTLRVAARSADAQTARVAIRALGRLERPTLVGDLLPGLRHRLPEVRAEAANAIAQALHAQRDTTPTASALTSAQNALAARLNVEADAGVRAAICEAIARLPYRTDADLAHTEATLAAFASRATSSTDRLGVAKGFEAFARLHGARHPAQPETIQVLTGLVEVDAHRAGSEALRDARVRRLALEALINLAAANALIATTAAADPDPQVRRLAARAAVNLDGAEAAITRGLTDPSAMVRIEALRAVRLRHGDGVCEPALGAVSDPDTHVSLGAIDQLAVCGSHSDAVAVLTHLVEETHEEGTRHWHRTAHALVALTSAAPDDAREALPEFVSSRIWQLRVHAARAATLLHDRGTLDTLSHDTHDNVVEAAVTGLSATVGHDADDAYVAALSSNAPPVIRAAALALTGSHGHASAVAALDLAWRRLEGETRSGAVDARSAVHDALVSLGARAPQHTLPAAVPAPLNAAELRRLAAPRARFTIRGLGSFDVALFTMEAPATVLRFAELAASGSYDGLGIHRVVANSVIEGGSPGANERSSAPVMRDEVGLWPHVRGALGMSTRGRDAGDGRLFINLVDNPQFDHTYTVFAQVLNGIDIVDRILEGDVIERVEVLP